MSNSRRACKKIRSYSPSNLTSIALWKIQKEGKWVPNKLTDENKKQRVAICMNLLSRFKKNFVHKIIRRDEKLILYDNTKCKKAWVDPGQPSTSVAKPKKVLLCLVELGRNHLLRASQTWPNSYSWELPVLLIKLSSGGKKTIYGIRQTKNDVAAW